jgi:hypothetical protein
MTPTSVLLYVSIVCDQENLNGWGKTSAVRKSAKEKIITIVEVK